MPERATAVAGMAEGRPTAERPAVGRFELVPGCRFGRPVPADRVPPAMAA
ncbi:hypothetical protein ACIA5C_41695 [Actinoplanes sp. NPDC051343]